MLLFQLLLHREQDEAQKRSEIGLSSELQILLPPPSPPPPQLQNFRTSSALNLSYDNET